MIKRIIRNIKIRLYKRKKISIQKKYDLFCDLDWRYAKEQELNSLYEWNNSIDLLIDKMLSVGIDHVEFREGLITGKLANEDKFALRYNRFCDRGFLLTGQISDVFWHAWYEDSPNFFNSLSFLYKWKFPGGTYLDKPTKFLKGVPSNRTKFIIRSFFLNIDRYIFYERKNYSYMKNYDCRSESRHFKINSILK